MMQPNTTTPVMIDDSELLVRLRVVADTLGGCALDLRDVVHALLVEAACSLEARATAREL